MNFRSLRGFGCGKRTLRRAALSLSLLAIVVPASAGADEAEAPDPPPGLGVWQAETAGLRVIETVLPGLPLAASAFPSGGLAVLAIEEIDGPTDREALEAMPLDERKRVLFRVRGEASDLEPILRDLPAEIDSLLMSGDDLWLGGDGELFRLEEDGELRRVIEQPGADLAAMARGGLVEDGRLLVPDVGALRHFDRDGQLLGETPLPTTADRRRRRLVLRSPNVTRLADGTLIAGPDVADTTRARHLILGEDGEVTEAWTRLGRPEDIEQHWYTLKDGEPVFVAATTEAGRMGVFEKLELRVFRLKADRTRAGRTTLFTTDSETIHWYEFEPVFLDWDNDGRQDLLLVQPDGMSPGDLVVELFKARAGRFDPKPRRSKLDAESATWHLGEDFDGDGLPDLAVGTGSLSIYRGTLHRRRVIEKEPWRQLRRDALRSAKAAVTTAPEAIPTTDDRPSFRGKVRVLDFTGDGRSDIAVVRRYEGRTVVRLVEIR